MGWRAGAIGSSLRRQGQNLAFTLRVSAASGRSGRDTRTPPVQVPVAENRQQTVARGVLPWHAQIEGILRRVAHMRGQRVRDRQCGFVSGHARSRLISPAIQSFNVTPPGLGADRCRHVHAALQQSQFGEVNEGDTGRSSCTWQYCNAGWLAVRRALASHDPSD
jgi:hypothetical protein